MAKKQMVPFDFMTLVNQQSYFTKKETDFLKEALIDFKERGGDNEDLTIQLNAFAKKDDWKAWRLFSIQSTARIASVISDFSGLEMPVVAALTSLKQPDVIRRAISLGANPDYPSRYDPSLVRASTMEQFELREFSQEATERRFADAVEVVRILLETGLDVNVTNDDGVTPLMNAARCGNHELVRLLLESGADIHRQSSRGLTALHVALGTMGPEGNGFLEDRHLKTTQVLLEAGANPMFRSFAGNTPLHTLALASDKRMTLDRARGLVKMLLEAGADIEAKNREGLTPLLLSVKTGTSHAAVLPALLDAGADSAAVTLQGSSITRLGSPEVKRQVKSILMSLKMREAMAGDAEVASTPSVSVGSHGML
jgi:ankyrin repeat protein